jgi:hypothetical protein
MCFHLPLGDRAYPDNSAIALSEQSQSVLICPDAIPLNHSTLRPAIQQAALDNHLDFLP